MICDESAPRIINIPTSGTTHKHIFKFLPRMLERTRGDAAHDQLLPRRARGAARPDPPHAPQLGEDARVDPLRASRSSKDFPHLVVGIHSVISAFNVDRFPEIYEGLQTLAPDSYITEVAEERAELLTMGTGITPPPEKYAEAVDFLMARMKAGRQPGFASVIEAFRLEYYELVKRILSERRQVIPCYAGLTSCHIAADGDLWGCCVRAEPVGNLRDVDYDFGRLWYGAPARRFRQQREGRRVRRARSRTPATRTSC